MTKSNFSPIKRFQGDSFQMKLRIIEPLQSCTPTSLIWGIFMKVKRPDWSILNGLTLYASECLYTFCHFPDQRWTFHSERVQPTDFDNSPLSHLTELQSVSPQQLIPPYRYSSESLHLEPPHGPLSVSPQVSSCVGNEDVTSVKRHYLHICDLKYVFLACETKIFHSLEKS